MGTLKQYNMKKCSTLLLSALALLLPTSLWAGDPDLTDYTLVKTMDFSSNTYDNDETYIELSSTASGITAYETGNAKQQSLYAVTSPSDLSDYLQLQQAYDGTNKGWWIRASKGGLWSYNASRSAAVVGLEKGYIVCFTAADGGTISDIMTLVNEDGEPDGNFTYEMSQDMSSYWCTMTDDGYVGFCGEKSTGYIASISIYAPPQTFDIDTYKVVKTMDFSSETYDGDDTYITLGSSTGITAYETGNAKQQTLYQVTYPTDLSDYLQLQSAYDGTSSTKGWWIRASKGGLWSYNASRSGAVVNLKEGYVVCFTAADGGEIASIMTLVNADDEPDGNFTYELSQDMTSYLCTMTADGYVGFCGEKSTGYIGSITIYAPPTALITPTGSITGVSGTGRVVTFEGVNLGYNTDGSDVYTITNQSSLSLTVTETTTFYVVSTEDDKISDRLVYTVEAGTEVSLNTPTVTFTDISNGYVKTFTVTCDNSTVFLNPTAELTYDFYGTDGTTETDVPIVGTVETYYAGIYVVKASADGYKTSTVVIDNTISYKKSYEVDFTSDALVDELSDNWVLLNESAVVPGSDTPTQWRIYYSGITTDEYYYNYSSSTASETDVIDGLTFEINENGTTPKLYTGFGLMYPVYKLNADGSNSSSAISYGKVGIADGTTDQVAVYTYINNYGNGGTKTAILLGDETYSLYRYSDLLTMVEVYSPTSSTAISLTVPALGYTTFVPSNNVVVPSDVEVYTVTISDDGEVTLYAVETGDVIPAQTGVLVKADPGDYSFAISTGAAYALENNDLVAALSTVTSEGTQYVLGDGTSGVGFYKASGSIAAGEAYLVYSGSASALLIDETTTSIQKIENNVVDEDAYYTIDGIKVKTPTKGIYIHNGKKVVVK